MTEAAAERVIATYQRDLGEPISHAIHRDFQLRGKEQKTIQVPNGYLCLLFCEEEVVISSDLGIYDRLSEGVAECQHVHSGEVTIQNFADTMKNAEFWAFLVP